MSQPTRLIDWMPKSSGVPLSLNLNNVSGGSVWGCWCLQLLLGQLHKVWLDGGGGWMVVPIMWSLPTHAGVEFGCDNFLIPAVSELHIFSDKTNNEEIAPFDLLCFLHFYIWPLGIKIMSTLNNNNTCYYSSPVASKSKKG